jgi:hypothetical protein
LLLAARAWISFAEHRTRADWWIAIGHTLGL